VCFDETQHLADKQEDDESTWGETVRALFPEFKYLLAMSATPIREDWRNIFGKEGVDVHVTYSDAVDEDAVKNLEVKSLNFNIKSSRSKAILPTRHPTSEVGVSSRGQ
jgi:superfamily II DNA or RNA helicase